MANDGNLHRYLLYRRRRRNGNGHGFPRWMMALIVLGGFIVVALGAAAVGGIAAYQSCVSDLDPPDEAIAKLPRGGARVYDRNGDLLFEYLSPVYGRRDPVPADQISLWLVAATIATEDASFLDNPGINIRGLARAAWENFSPFGDTPGLLEGSGGSSITQQLVKNVYFPPEERAKRSIERKWTEVCYSLEITRDYSKQQIMEWYLNQIPYGNIYTGAEAASQGYFHKPASDLTLAEAALLAGIPANPPRFDPLNNFEAARTRQLHVLERMQEEGYITAAQRWVAASQQIKIQQPRFDIKAPHFVFNVIEPELDRLFGEEAKLRDGLEVHTTIDMRWQREAERILEEQIAANEGSFDAHNGAFVAIDPKTAQVIVYVGSRDFFNPDIDGQNDNAGALNSPGSAFKPFTYLTLFKERGWGPGSYILDTPYTYRDGGGSFTPCNPSGCGSFQGQLTVRDALGNSLNVPAVKAMLYAGVPEVIAQAKLMGLTSLDREFLGPALTTGGGDVRLIDMVYGFSVFPNLGLLKGVETSLDLPPGNRALDPVSIARVTDRSGNVLYPLVDGQPVEGEPPLREERVAPPEETYMVTDILVDPNAECITFRCGALSLPDGREFAVKTGTSAPYETNRLTGDTWAIAYTPQLVAGGWYGNEDNAPIGFASSTVVSWPIIQEFMTLYHQDQPVEQFQRPDGLIEAEVCVLSHYRPTSDCPLTTPNDLFAKSALPPDYVQELEGAAQQPEPQDQAQSVQQQPNAQQQGDDPWWDIAEIDTRTNLLASDLTPPAFRKRMLFLELPPGLSDFEVGQAQEWVRRLGATLAGAPAQQTKQEDIPKKFLKLEVAITIPPDGSQVTQGLLTITGRANFNDGGFYVLQVSGAPLPGGAQILTQSNQPVADGVLGQWNATLAPPGRYVIRLIVVDPLAGESSTEVRINIVAVGLPPPALPTPSPTPPGQPPGPPGGGGPGPPGGG